MNEEEKNAIEYLKTRLYGNEGCKYIDVAQEDLRTFINLVDRKEKEIEGWKKYCEEIEEEQTEMSNKNCELEFEVEKLQKENEELKDFKKQVTEIESTNFIKYKNYISKQEVKDKIEEINKKILNAPKYDEKISVYRYQKQILQELIGESEEK